MFVTDSKKTRHLAELYFEEIKEYYHFFVYTMNEDDYEIVKNEFGYKTTYEDHIKGELEGIPEDDNETILKIIEFLDEFVIFQQDFNIYYGFIKELNRKVVRESEEVKSKAFLLMKDMRDFKKDIRELYSDDEESESENTTHCQNNANDEKGCDGTNDDLSECSTSEEKYKYLKGKEDIFARELNESEGILRLKFNDNTDVLELKTHKNPLLSCLFTLLLSLFGIIYYKQEPKHV